MEHETNAAERIIRRFGGQSALAALLGKRQSTIEHWARTGRVPAQWHVPLMSLGRQRGVILEAKDFVELKPNPIQPAEGRLGILLVGLGAVASTFISGVEHARRGSGRPVGSLTQMGTIRLGKRTEDRVPLIRDFVPLAGLEQLAFGAWDIFPDDALEAAEQASVLERSHLDAVADELRAIRPMPGVFYPGYVKRLGGTHTKTDSARRPRSARMIRSNVTCTRSSKLGPASCAFLRARFPSRVSKRKPLQVE